MNLNDMTLGQIKMTLGQIKDEIDVHLFLRGRGFETNYTKKKNENGIDIIALKDGKSYLIEVKKIVKNSVTGIYKLSDDNIKGEIIIGILPNGKIIPVFNAKTNFNKAIELLMSL